MFDLMAKLNLWEQTITCIVLIIVIMALIYIVLSIESKIILYFVYKSMKRQEERRNLRSPAWADTMEYWRTEDKPIKVQVRHHFK